MKSLVPVLLLALALPAPALAQAKPDDHSSHHPAAGGADAAAAAMSEGEVRKIDRDASRVTIRHGEIRNLGMPPMTMVFTVPDKAMLGRVKAGDKVRFTALDDAGKLTLTAIETLP